MSIPPNQIIQARLLSAFPAQVVAGPGMTITRANGVYTFQWNVADFNPIQTILTAEQSSHFIAIYNANNTAVPFNIMAMDDFITLAVASLLGGLNNPEPLQVTTSPFVVANDTRNIAIVRGPGVTALTLPAVAARGTVPLRVFDWSPGILGVPGAEHAITATPAGGQTIMKGATHTIVSNEAGLASVEYFPSVNLAGWYA